MSSSSDDFLRGRPASPADGASRQVEEIAEKLHTIWFVADGICAKDALKLTTYVVCPDARGFSVRRFWEKRLAPLVPADLPLPRAMFLEWSTGKIAGLFGEWGRRCGAYPPSLLALSPLHSWLYPSASNRNYWRTPEGWYASGLTDAGASALISGDRKRGKTSWLLRLAENANRLHREHVERGRLSLFAQIHKHQARVRRQAAALAGREVAPADGGAEAGPAEGSAGGATRLGLFWAEEFELVSNVQTQRGRDENGYELRAFYADRLSGLFARLAYRYWKVFRWLGIDELGAVYKSTRATSQSNIFLEDSWRSVGKLNAAMETSTHHPKEELPKAFVRESRTTFQKTEKSEMVANVPDLFRYQLIEEIPDTGVRYDQSEFPTLIIDINPAQMFEWVAREKARLLESDPDGWSDERNAEKVIYYCEHFAATDAEIAAGRNPALMAAIRMELELRRGMSKEQRFTEVQVATGAAIDLIERADRQLEVAAKVRAKRVKEQREVVREEVKRMATAPAPPPAN